MQWFILPAITLAGLAIVATARADGTDVTPLAPRALVSKSTLAWPIGEPQDMSEKVVLNYVIEPDGTVDHVIVEAGPSRPFDNAARQAVQRFVYRSAPTATTGRAIAVFDPGK
jgi:TonB family protein